ncbi:MAG: hypothetical protein AAGK09_03860 [Planctomycetota bacterium]
MDKYKLGDPICTHCGYNLTGATQTPTCPECGKPLVEVLARVDGGGTAGRRYKRYRSEATVFGWPLIDVAYGPDHGEMFGTARGVVAIGDVAIGGVAMGNIAVGGVALGGVALGLVAFGGAAVGAVAAFGGAAISCGLSAGGLAVGSLPFGGTAIKIW